MRSVRPSICWGLQALVVMTTIIPHEFRTDSEEIVVPIPTNTLQRRGSIPRLSKEVNVSIYRHGCDPPRL